MELKAVNGDIAGLRKTGEDILDVTKNLDKAARDRVEHTIKLSQLALLIVFPLFLLIGLGSIFLILSSVTMRLEMLTNVVEHTGKGVYPRVPQVSGDPTHKDEVDVLVEKFNTMEKELAQRERELAKKTEELMQTKKLAAIGTLASGVAHELNNPLNNIYLSAQVLAREVTEGFAFGNKRNCRRHRRADRAREADSWGPSRICTGQGTAAPADGYRSAYTRDIQAACHDHCV